MGKWMAAFLGEIDGDPAFSPRANSAFSAISPTGGVQEEANGTIGTNGTPGETANDSARPRDEHDLRDDYEERAAILEHDAHLSRAEAERRAWAEVYRSKEATP